MNLQNKKIAFIIILFCLLMIIYSLMTKDYDLYGEAFVLARKGFEIPLELYSVDFILLKIPYTYTILFLISLLGLGVYLFLFKTDEALRCFLLEQRERLKIQNFLENIKRKKNLEDQGKLFSFPKELQDLALKVVLFTIFLAFLWKLNSHFDSLKRPMTLFEAIISGFSTTLIPVSVFVFAVSILKKIFSKEKKDLDSPSKPLP